MQNIRDRVEKHTTLFEFSEQLIKNLKEKKFKIGLISNSSIFAYKSLKSKTNLLNYIDVPIFSFEIGAVKPNPKIYLELINKTNYSPEEILIIGDKLNEDVLTPRRFGFNSIHFKTYNQLIQELNKKYKIKPS
jgi:HAD superfamily hydrolase (TIGR01549 family)